MADYRIVEYLWVLVFIISLVNLQSIKFLPPKLYNPKVWVPLFYVSCILTQHCWYTGTFFTSSHSCHDQDIRTEAGNTEAVLVLSTTVQAQICYLHLHCANNDFHVHEMLDIITKGLLSFCIGAKNTPQSLLIDISRCCKEVPLPSKAFYIKMHTIV